MTREKYNLKLAVDLDHNATFGDIRRFVEILSGMPDDMPVIIYEDLNAEIPTLFGYIDQVQEASENT